MLLEFAIHSLEYKDIDIKNTLVQIKDYNLDYISIFSYYLRLAKRVLCDSDTKISCPIDFPLGVSDTDTRKKEIEYAIKCGASKVDVMIPSLLLSNRKYDKFREDVKINQELCLSNNVEINYVLEYRLFDYVVLTKIADILYHNDIKKIYPSSGYMLDNINDNIIACMYLNQKTNIKCITTADVWLKNHIVELINNKVYGIRFKNINALKLFYETDKVI